jgi:hypothetical protein
VDDSIKEAAVKRIGGKSCKIPLLAVAAAMSGKRTLIVVASQVRKGQVEKELSKYSYPRNLISVEVIGEIECHL